MAAGNASSSVGLLLLREAVTVAPDLFPLLDRLQLRQACKALRIAVSKTLSTARFWKVSEADVCLPAEQFAAKGWPATTKHITLSSGATSVENTLSLVAMLNTDFPKLETISLPRRFNDVNAATCAILAAKSASWPQLKTLAVDGASPAQLQILLQGRWQIKKLTINGTHYDDQELFERIDWQNSVPLIEELVLGTSGFDDENFQLPASLLQADLPHLRKLSSGYLLSNPIGFEQCRWLKQLEGLSLGLGNVDCTPLMQALAGCDQLVDLYLREEYNLPEIRLKLPHLARLKTLELVSSDAHLLNAIVGVKFPSLTSLKMTLVSWRVIFENFQNIDVATQFPSLTSLHCNVKLAPAGLVKLGQLLPQVDSFTAVRLLLNHESLDALTRGARAFLDAENSAMQLRSLTCLGYYREPVSPKFISDFLSSLLVQKMHHLEELGIEGDPLPESSAWIFAHAARSGLFAQSIKTFKAGFQSENAVDAIIEASKHWSKLEKLVVWTRAPLDEDSTLSKIRDSLPHVLVESIP